MDIKEVLKEYKKTGNIQLKNKVVEEFIPFVRYVAKKVYNDLFFEDENYNSHNKFFNYDDCVQAGYIGLMDAIKKYNPIRETNFTNFSYKRIKGEIYDELR